MEMAKDSLNEIATKITTITFINMMKHSVLGTEPDPEKDEEIVSELLYTYFSWPSDNEFFASTIKKLASEIMIISVMTLMEAKIMNLGADDFRKKAVIEVSSLIKKVADEAEVE